MGSATAHVPLVVSVASTRISNSLSLKMTNAKKAVAYRVAGIQLPPQLKKDPIEELQKTPGSFGIPVHGTIHSRPVTGSRIHIARRPTLPNFRSNYSNSGLIRLETIHGLSLLEYSSAPWA